MTIISDMRFYYIGRNKEERWNVKSPRPNYFEFNRSIWWRSALLRLMRNKLDFNQNSKSNMETTAVTVPGPLIVIHSASSLKNTDHECLMAALPRARQAWWTFKMSCACDPKHCKRLETLLDNRGVFWRETSHRKCWWYNFPLCSKLSWNLVEIQPRVINLSPLMKHWRAHWLALRGLVEKVERCIFVFPYMGRNQPRKGKGIWWPYNIKIIIH